MNTKSDINYEENQTVRTFLSLMARTASRSDVEEEEEEDDDLRLRPATLEEVDAGAEGLVEERRTRVE